MNNRAIAEGHIIQSVQSSLKGLHALWIYHMVGLNILKYYSVLYKIITSICFKYYYHYYYYYYDIALYYYFK